jgi:hypothetical protein
MLFVSLIVEFVRSKPRAVFWVAILAQALLWTLTPALVYSAPPGNVPEVLAIGHELRFFPEAGPPLAYWLADIAFAAAGQRALGIYVLSQICVVIAAWAVFTLGRAIAGDRHAVIGALLMIGVSAFAVPTPDFGPAILAMPLWALALLFLWRAGAEGRAIYWLALAVDFSLLLLTSYLALVLFLLVVVFVLAEPEIRARLWAPEPCAAGIAVAFMTLPAVATLLQSDEVLLPNLMRLREVETVYQNLFAWIRLFGTIVLSHAGLAVLIAIAGNMTWLKRKDVPVITREPASILAQHFVYYFAIVPPLAIPLLAAIGGYAGALNPAPLVILSGLAVVVAAGDRIAIHHQRLLTLVWGGFLLLPPILTAIVVLITPWMLGVDLKVAQPATDYGRFFSENFERRTGNALAVVGGDERLAALIALGAHSRPSVFIDRPGFPKTATMSDIAEKGAIIVWPATDTAGSPPPDIKARFPEIAPELPHTFQRTIQGRLPLRRVGWGMIRPKP